MGLGKNETFAEFLIHYRLQYNYKDFNPIYIGCAATKAGDLRKQLDDEDIIPPWTEVIYLSIK